MRVYSLDSTGKFYQKELFHSDIHVQPGDRFLAKVLFTANSMVWLEMENGEKFRAVCREMMQFRQGSMVDFLVLEKHAAQLLIKPVAAQEDKHTLAGRNLNSAEEQMAMTATPALIERPADLRQALQMTQCIKLVQVPFESAHLKGDISIHFFEEAIKRNQTIEKQIVLQFRLFTQNSGTVLVQTNVNGDNLKCGFWLETQNEVAMFRKHAVNLFDALLQEGYHLTRIDCKELPAHMNTDNGSDADYFDILGLSENHESIDERT